MSTHETRPDSPVETTEDSQDPCQHWRENQRFRSQLQMRTSALSPIGEESRKAPRNSHGDGMFLRPHERVPEVLVVTQEERAVSCCDSRKTRIFSPQCEMRPFSTAASREKSDLPSWASKGSLTRLRELKKFPDIPVST